MGGLSLPTAAAACARGKSVESSENLPGLPHSVTRKPGEFSENARFYERIDSSEHVLGSRVQLRRDSGCVHNRLADEHIRESPSAGVTPGPNPLVPILSDASEFEDQLPTIRYCRE